MATMNTSNAPNLLSTPNQAGQLSAPTSLLQAQPPTSGLLDSSYFPVSKKMGLPGQANDLMDIMQNAGEGPQLQNVINAVQAQYNPETYTANGQSYGAGRFMQPTDFGAFTPATSPTPAFSFTPNVFDINNYPALSNTPTAPVAPVAVPPVVAPVDSSDGGGLDFTPTPTTNVAGSGGTNNTGGPAYDPYKAIETKESGLAKLALSIPAVGPFISLGMGANQGWDNAAAANALATGIAAYGEDVSDLTTNPYTAALAKAVGVDTSSIQAAKALVGPDGTYSSVENLYGDLTAANDPTVKGIVSFINNRDGVPRNANEAGKLGFDISTQIHSVIASSRDMGLNHAVMLVAEANGMTPDQALFLAASLQPDSTMQEVANSLNTKSVTQPATDVNPQNPTVADPVVEPSPKVYVEFTDAEKATFNDSMVAAAAAEGKTVQQKVYEVAIAEGVSMDGLDKLLGLPSGYAASYEAEGYKRDVLAKYEAAAQAERDAQAAAQRARDTTRNAFNSGGEYGYDFTGGNDAATTYSVNMDSGLPSTSLGPLS
jgi:hypothetical protein